MRTPWRLVQRKARRWGPAVLCLSLSGSAAAYFLAAIPQAYRYWLERAPLRELARQAEKTGLEYDDVVRDPRAARGKTVRWFITHPGNHWFCGDDQNRPVRWSFSAPPPMVETGQSGGSRGEWVLATVVSAGPGGVVLSFRGFD